MPYKEDPERHRARAAAYHAAHRENVHTRQAAYYAAHREERIVSAAVYRAAHPEKRLASDAAYRAAHPEKARAHQAAYRAAHPEKRREDSHHRRARVRAQFVAPVDAAAIYIRDRGRCHICGKHVKRVDASMDHLKPISLGGAHAPWNVSLAHLKCNLRRNAYGEAQLRLTIE